MKIVEEPGPIICEQCEKVFYAKYAHFCPACRKKQSSERAKRIGLCNYGATGRWGKKRKDEKDR